MSAEFTVKLQANLLAIAYRLRDKVLAKPPKIEKVKNKGLRFSHDLVI